MFRRLGLAPPPETKPVGQHAANRKCPKCAARDFRASDRQRTRPDDYRSRTYRVKWLCLACGYRETEDLEEA